MKIKYCLPIIESNLSSIIENIESYKNDYGFFEIWLDYIHDLDESRLFDLLMPYEKRIVLVFRRFKLEKPKMKPELRSRIIKKLNGRKYMVDLDISQNYEIDQVNSLDKKPSTIFSYHNYEMTPEDDELARVTQYMESLRPSIIKIACNCSNPRDALRLMGLKVRFIENDRKHIVLGMGEHGKITRIFGALWNNELTFAPTEHVKSSAPGQITKAEFDKIFKDID